MGAYVIRRLLWLPVVLLVVTFFTFTIARFGPGDPVSVAAGQIRDPEVLAQIRADRGLDGTIVEQYQRWLFDAVRGDFGESFQQRGFTVSEIIFPKMWISAQLGMLALVIVFGVGIPLGLLAARLSGTWVDPFVIGTLLFLQAIPVLVVIPPLLWLFAVQYDILPVGGWDGLFDIWWIGGVIAIPIPDPHLYIPLLAFTLPGFAGVARLTRITALEVQREDYIRTARAKGLPESAVAFRHVLPNSLLPLVTVVAFALAGVVEGAFFVETLLGIPGIGRFTFEAVVSRDYDAILATTVVFSVLFVLMNLAADLTYGLVDPRVRVGATRS
ncbi:MAG: ABC transporter permease [Chloroflexi bacterium]|nr:ABC transporter permease [Chloroflexota bacterium]MDA1145704.1 ABC transporter permease [Chloroflexota bacterium]